MIRKVTDVVATEVRAARKHEAVVYDNMDDNQHEHDRSWVAVVDSVGAGV